jgi:hypothetical protein
MRITRWLAALAVAIITASGFATWPAAADTQTFSTMTAGVPDSMTLLSGCNNYTFTYSIVPLGSTASWAISWGLSSPLLADSDHATIGSFEGDPTSGVQSMYICGNLDGPGAYTLIVASSTGNVTGHVVLHFAMSLPAPPVVIPPVVIPPVVVPPAPPAPPAPAPVVRTGTRTALQPTRLKVRRGASVLLLGRVQTLNGVPVSSARVTFQARTLAHGWRTLGSGVSVRGLATLRDWPQVGTSYRALYLGSATRTPSHSRSMQVGVRR